MGGWERLGFDRVGRGGVKLEMKGLGLLCRFEGLHSFFFFFFLIFKLAQNDVVLRPGHLKKKFD